MHEFMYSFSQLSMSAQVGWLFFERKKRVSHQVGCRLHSLFALRLQEALHMIDHRHAVSDDMSMEWFDEHMEAMATYRAPLRQLFVTVIKQ